MFEGAPPPKSLLNFPRILSPTCGLRVSPLCLGAMNFGEAWKPFMGECGKETSFEILDFFYENGGNFIDSANVYQDGESEEWVGEWMDKRGIRDEIVLATKYTTTWQPEGQSPGIRYNLQGNHAKSLYLSTEASLRKLKTSYVDIMYVHWWDFSTSIPELMQSLNRLVIAGKVLYLGISDTPAWIVSKANEYSRNHGLAQFSVYQGRWSAANRDLERDILPMCEEEGMAILGFGALGSGRFKTKAQMENYGKDGGRNAWKPSEKDKQISSKLEEIADKKGTQLTSVAMAYIMHKYPYCIPLIGGRKIEHLKANIEALGLKLTDEEIDAIEDSAEFDIGYPMHMLFGLYNSEFKYRSRMTTQNVTNVENSFHLETPAKKRAIAARTLEEKVKDLKSTKAF